MIRPIPGFQPAAHETEWLLMAISVGLALVSAIVGYHFYVRNPEAPKKVAHSLGPIYRLVNHKYWVDEIYFKLLINPLVKLSKDTWYFIDVNFIDKITYWLADLMNGGGQLVRTSQTGNMQQYAMYIGLGLVVAISIIIMR